LKAIAGTYQTTRRSDSTKLKMGNLFGQVRASVDKDGILRLTNFKDLRGHSIQWKPVAKDLWQEVDEQEMIFAIRDGKNRVVRLALDFPGVQLQRVPWYENRSFVLPAAGASLAVLVLVVIASLLRLGRRIFLRKRARLAPQPGTAWLSFGPRLGAFTWVIILSSVAAYFLSAGDDLMPPTPAWFPWFTAMNWATAFAIFLSLFAFVSGTRVWWRANLRWITKFKFMLVGLACLILSWVAVHWNLIGPAHRI